MWAALNLKFLYDKFLLDEPSPFFGNSIQKPVIPIGILFSEREIRYPALVDSGADFSIFPAELGSRLGIDITAGLGMPFAGIQSVRPSIVFMHNVQLRVGGWLHPATVGFSYEIGKYGHGILDQKGFFDIFKITFDYVKGEIELREYKHS